MKGVVSLSILLIGVFVGAAVLAPVGTAAPAAVDGAETDVAERAGSGGEAASVATEASALETSVTVSRTEGETVEYTIQLADAPDSNRLWVVLRGSATVVSAPGFERTEADGVTRLVWTGEQETEASPTVTVAADAAANSDGAATDAWAFGRVPFVELQWAVDGAVERSWPLAERRAVDADEQAVVGARYAVVGTHQTVTRTTSTGRIDLVVPTGAMTGTDSGEVADALVRAARDLDVGDRDDATLAFAAPGSVRWGGESVPTRDEFWVNAESELDSAEAVWLHEYVHTRQSFTLAADMEWFREASAEYYAARLSREQGLIGQSEMERHLDGDPSTATLTDRRTWASDDVPHRKGGRVLAVLDQRIREQTYGHRSLEAVFHRLNRHDGPVTYTVFAQTVAEVTGNPSDAWLERHVNGSTPVADQYGPDARPLAATLLTGLGVGDTATGATGVLATVHGQGVAFFSVATGFSVVAALPLYGALSRLQRRDRRDGEQVLSESTRA